MQIKRQHSSRLIIYSSFTLDHIEECARSAEFNRGTSIKITNYGGGGWEEIKKPLATVAGERR